MFNSIISVFSRPNPAPYQLYDADELSSSEESCDYDLYEDDPTLSSSDETSYEEVSVADRAPAEVLVHLFTFLSAKELKQCLFVNRLWNACARTNTLWINLCLQLDRPVSDGCDAMKCFYRFHPGRIEKDNLKIKKSKQKALKSYMRIKQRWPHIYDWPSPGYSWHKSTLACSNPKEKDARVFDLREKTLSMTLPEAADQIDFDETSVVTLQTQQGLIKEWKKDADGKVQAINSTNIGVYDMLSLDGDRIFLTMGCNVTWLDRETKSQGPLLGNKKYSISSMTSFGRFLACGSEKGSVRIWDVRDSSEVFHARKKTGPIESLALSDYYTVVAADDDSVKGWDRRNDKVVLFEVKHTTSLRFAELRYNILAIAKGSTKKNPNGPSVRDTTVTFWDVNTSRKLKEVEDHSFSRLPLGMRWTDTSLTLLQNNGTVFSIDLP